MLSYVRNTHGLLKNWRVVLCIKYAWPIKSFKTGPPYGLLCAHELMFFPLKRSYVVFIPYACTIRHPRVPMIPNLM